MHSIAAVRSASGAASYFAKDDYYTGEHASEASEWGGKGAEYLGLAGEVGKVDFENLLNGKLPNGSIAHSSPNRRAGIDLTFSMPKSASVMAYVAGDTRILAGHLTAVKATMRWVEETLAEARDYRRTSNGEGVRTGNLVYAMFQHDTSRKLDPQGHVHVVVAAITQSAAGKWKALWNGEFWKNNATIGSVYHAAFRTELANIGYETELTGKHGQFEIRGVPKPVLDEFSQRRKDILAKAEQLGRSPSDAGSMREITKRSRAPKLDVDDRAVLRAQWMARSISLGFDGKALLAKSIAQSGQESEAAIGIPAKVHALVEIVRSILGNYLQGFDPLTTNGIARAMLSPSQLRTEMAVGSAIRILGQREAAFGVTALRKSALDLGLRGVTIDCVDRRVAHLIESGQLIRSVSERLDGVFSHLTTPEHVAQERMLLAGIDRGRKASLPIIAAGDVKDRLRTAAEERPLNAEQLAAATVALSTRDRIVVIQGVAGAGKTTMIEAMTHVAAQEGRETIGLAFANKMVAMLRNEAGIEACTVSSFVNEHIRGATAGQGSDFEQSRQALAGKILILDESSLVANEAMNHLLTIANSLRVARLIMIGDHHQLQSIDAGKAFRLIQTHDPEMARMETSLRQKSDHMQQVAALTRGGNFEEAFEVLGPRVQAKGDAYLEAAASAWLARSLDERERTAIYASGRSARSALNDLVQKGLKAEGSITGEGIRTPTVQSANVTREELRYAHTYRTGLVVDVVRMSPTAQLGRGRYEVIGIDRKDRVVLRSERGQEFRFDPRRIGAAEKLDAIQISERTTVSLHAGDVIRWTANDKDRGLLNSEPAQIIAADIHRVTVRTGEGTFLDLNRDDRMLERLVLAYAINMHQGQGMTSDEGIGVAHSSEKNLATQRLMHVMVTRVRHDIQIFTDDRDKLLRTIERNEGDKASALEIIGEKPMEQKRTVDPAQSGPFKPYSQDDTIRQPPTRPVQQVAGFSIGGMDSAEKLPERGIERTR